MSIPLTTSSAGIAPLLLTFPVDPAMHGDRFFNQVTAIDLAANALGVVASDAGIRQFAAPFSGVAVARVESLGSFGPTGITTVGTAAVTQFVR